MYIHTCMHIPLLIKVTNHNKCQHHSHWKQCIYRVYTRTCIHLPRQQNLCSANHNSLSHTHTRTPNSLCIGQAGKRIGCSKPFEVLNSEQLRQELVALGVYDFGRTKKDRVDTLKSTLRGIQRVPTILLNNPTESLTQINLEGYTVLDCEPLHDIKGHFENLLLELPHVLESTLSAEVRKVLKVDLWDKTTKRGADYRVAMIHTLSVLQRQTPTNILQVVETAVDISSILYQEEIQRSPKAVLRLYNKTWLHFELSKELFSATSTITHQKFFGIYLHALTLHAPPQYEILNLKSANTEHEERLFGQAKQIVNNASNRHPNNVIPNILLRLQAKQMKKDLYKTYHMQVVYLRLLAY